jgi:hypothetical protein
MDIENMMPGKYTKPVADFLKKAWDDPLFWKPAKSVSMTWLFPGLLIGTTCNQQTWSVGLLLIGRTASFLTLVAALVIVWSSTQEKKWPILVFAGLLISRAGRVLFGSSAVWISFYTVFLAILFCLAGAVIAQQRPKMIYRQVLFFCAISIPLMVLQLTGAGEWTQILRTDYHGMETGAQYPTLFVGSDVVITTLQARPAGFVWANNFLSMIIMFAMGLHFGRIQSDELTWEDVTLCAITVIAMAKILFLTFLVLILWSYFSGDQLAKRRMKKVTATFICAIMLYAFFFPGFFAFNTSVDLLVRNFNGRFQDLAWTLEAKSFWTFDIAGPISRRTGHLDPIKGSAGHESGYAALAESASPYLLIALFFLMPFYLKGLRHLNTRFPEYKDTTIALIIVLMLIPLITSFIEGAVFWFIAGFAFLPLLLQAGLVYFRDELSPANRIV